MGYFILLLWGGWGVVLAIYWAVSAGGGAEESEHVIYVFVSMFMVFLIFPSLEGGMGAWGAFTLVVIGGFFLMTSPFWVYVFLEFSLLPMMVLIMGWGLQPERVSALYHFLVYTFVLSSPFLVGVMMCESSNSFKSTMILSFFMSLAFMVKLPLFLLHVWLPKAHVEAPTVGSIILAGILLKMGGIGFLWIHNFCSGEWNIFWLYCAMWGGAISAVFCCLQSDVKSFVAYSSVAHMNYSLVVMCLSSVKGDSSSSILMLSHSFISSLFLFFAGTCFHFLGSRLLYFFQVSFLFKSFLFMFLVMVVVSNLSVPPSLGFLGEAVFFMMGLSKFWSGVFCFLLYLFFVAYYSLFLGFSFAGKEASSSFEIAMVALCVFVAFALLNFLFFLFY